MEHGDMTRPFQGTHGITGMLRVNIESVTMVLV